MYGGQTKKTSVDYPVFAVPGHSERFRVTVVVALSKHESHQELQGYWHSDPALDNMKMFNQIIILLGCEFRK